MCTANIQKTGKEINNKNAHTQSKMNQLNQVCFKQSNRMTFEAK